MKRLFRKIKRITRLCQQKYKSILFAITGRSFVSLRGHCFHCNQDYYIELYKNFNFPLSSPCGCKDPDSFDFMTFNDYGYYPPLIERLDKRIVESARTGGRNK